MTTADDLRPILKSYADALAAAGAAPCADAMRHLARLIGGRNLREIARRYRSLLLSLDGNADLLPRAFGALVGLKNLLACTDNKASSESLQLFLDALNEQEERASEVPVETASNSRRKKGAVSMDRQLVERYLKSLTAALGDDLAFEKVYNDLATDSSVTRIEAVAIADKFLGGGVPPSTSRPKALQSIRYRHDKLKDFKRASKLIGRGKDAA
jgi:hypothetical protein